MASAAEQLASNLNFSTFAKAEDLKKRIWFTLGALLVYRLGTYIPLPGINPEAFARPSSSQSGGILGLFNMFRRRRQRMAIFALGIMPYISASIIVQLMTSVVPRSRPEEGRRAGPQDHQPVHPLRHGDSRRSAGLRHRGRPGGRQGNSSSAIPACSSASPPRHAARRHDVPDVARRADHLARHRQRHFADHLRRHRRRIAARSPARSNSAAPGALSTGLILLVIVDGVASSPSSCSWSAPSAGC
jgi:hypothetical protein